MEQPPQSYLQAVQDAFDSLPDELPVKARPLRTFCPGLRHPGGLRRAGGGGRLRPQPGKPRPDGKPARRGPAVSAAQRHGGPAPRDGKPQPTHTHPHPPGPQPAGGTAGGGAGPVPAGLRAERRGGHRRHFTVEDAWSDGIYLHLRMAARLSDPAWQQEEILFTQTEPYMEDSETFQVTVDGAAAELVTPLENRVFTLEEASDDGSSLYRAEWVAKLPHKLSQNQEMEVSLSLFLFDRGLHRTGLPPGLPAGLPRHGGHLPQFPVEHPGGGAVRGGQRRVPPVGGKHPHQPALLRGGALLRPHELHHADPRRGGGLCHQRRSPGDLPPALHP